MQEFDFLNFNEPPKHTTHSQAIKDMFTQLEHRARKTGLVLCVSNKSEGGRCHCSAVDGDIFCKSHVEYGAFYNEFLKELLKKHAELLPSYGIDPASVVKSLRKREKRKEKKAERKQKISYASESAR